MSLMIQSVDRRTRRLPDDGGFVLCIHLDEADVCIVADSREQVRETAQAILSLIEAAD
jgi:hypothetical protein